MPSLRRLRVSRALSLPNAELTFDNVNHGDTCHCTDLCLNSRTGIRNDCTSLSVVQVSECATTARREAHHRMTDE